MSLTLDRLEEIKIVDSGGDELAIDASGYITVNLAAGSTVAVTATQLDIDDLVYTTDSVTAHQGGTWTIDSITNDVNVTATDLDIRSLVNTQDSVAIGDETNLVDMQQMDSAFGVTSYGFPMFGVRRDADTSPVSATGDAHPLVFDALGALKVSGNLALTEDSYDTIATQVATVGTSAVELASTPLSNRKNVIIQNLGASDIYVGEDNTVTTSTGLLVSKKSNLEFKCSATCDVWAISGSAGNDIRIFEMAD